MKKLKTLFIIIRDFLFLAFMYYAFYVALWIFY